MSTPLIHPRPAASGRIAWGLLALGAVFSGPLTGCSSSNDSGTVVYNVSSLSGTVRGNGVGLPGVTISVGTASGISNAAGDFILPSLGSISAGVVTVNFNGATATLPGTFAILDVVVPLQAGTNDLVMPNVINLPDLAGVDSATQTVTLAADGATAAPILVAGVQPDIVLNGAMGTIVTIDGAVGALTVDINITPVPTTQIPMPLPDGLLGGSFVTIQPSDAAFDPPGATEGLDVILPNDLNFPVGTVVDIWSFDHAAGAWVNRSQQTGQTGVVVAAGGGLTNVQATGVIVEGGWHAPVLTVDPSCGTTLTGRVVDLITGNGIAGASVGLDTGQFGSTDANGNFTIVSVPAYDVSLLLAQPPACITRDLDIEIVLPPSHGSLSMMVTALSTTIVAGGTTDIGDTMFNVISAGNVAGLVTGVGATTNEQVMLTPVIGGTTIMITPDSTGSFFMTGLAAGDYLSSFLFAGAAGPVEETITITANQTTAYSIQFALGDGARDILVQVFREDDNAFTPPTRVSGAPVLLQGTDSASMIGLLMTTDANGEALFEGVDGPFTVTASTDVLDQGDTLRLATSMIDINPADDIVSVLIFVETAPSITVIDATIMGTVMNMPVLGTTESMDVTIEATGFQGDTIFSATFPVNPADGTYSGGVPSGYVFEAIVLRLDSTIPSSIVSSLLLTGIPMTTPAGTITQDFDYASANVVPWNNPAPITFSNLDASVANVNISVEVTDLANGILVSGDPYFGPPTPFLFNFPDPTHAGLTGFKLTLGCDAEGGAGDLFQDRSFVLTTTPAGIDFDFMPVPTPISPIEGDSFTLAQLLALDVSFTEGSSGGLGNSGLNFSAFETKLGIGTPPAGIDGSVWEFILPAGVTMVTVPLAPLPMFTSGQGLFGQTSQFRALGVTVDYNTFFNGNFEANFAALVSNNTESSNSEIEINFSIQ